MARRGRQFNRLKPGWGVECSPFFYCINNIMIHIATVHIIKEEWVDIQFDYIKRNFEIPHKIYSLMRSIRIKEHREKYERCVTYGQVKNKIEIIDRDKHTKAHPSIISKTSVDHCEKLNYLGKSIARIANGDDIIVFLDSDAFPIKPIGKFIEEALNDYDVVSIQRTEIGDNFPHPSFCTMKIKTWRRLKEKWLPWSHVPEERNDTGANLIIPFSKLKWKKLHRSNIRNEHGLFYGVYNDLIYHHGAGSRKRISQFEHEKGYNVEQLLKSNEYEELLLQSEKMMEEIKVNPEFYKRFID